jgi:hypothetical protein
MSADRCQGCAKTYGVAWSQSDKAMLCPACYAHRAPAVSPDDLADLEAQAPSVNGNGAHPARVVPEALRVLDTRAMLATTPPPVRYVLEPIAARGHLNLLAGREKTGKSMLAFAAAVAATHGADDLAGMAVHGASAMIVDAENGAGEVHRRLHGMGVSPEHADALVLVEARGFNLTLHLQLLTDLVDEHEPDLLVLDSFASMWSGDENDQGDVHKALDPLRNFAHDRPNLAVLLLHHTLKGGSEYRGSTGIGAAVENISLLGRNDDDEDGHRRKLRHNRSRFAPDGVDWWFAIERSEDGLITLTACDPYVPEGSPLAADELVRQADELAVAIALDGGWSPRRLADELGVDRAGGTFARLRKLLRARGWRFEGATRQALVHPPQIRAIRATPLGPGANGANPNGAAQDDERAAHREPESEKGRP